MDLKQQLREMLIRDLNLEDVSPEELTDDLALFGDEEGLGLDSLDAVELVVAVQKNFGVEISNIEEGQVAFRSISTLAACIEEKQNA